MNQDGSIIIENAFVVKEATEEYATNETGDHKGRPYHIPATSFAVLWTLRLTRVYTVDS